MSRPGPTRSRLTPKLWPGIEPKEKARQGPDRRRWWGWAEALAHRHVPTTPLLTALPTPSTPGQDRLSGNADPPKIELFV